MDVTLGNMRTLVRDIPTECWAAATDSLVKICASFASRETET